MYVGVRDAAHYLGGGVDDDLLDELYGHCARFATTLQVPEDRWPRDRAAFEQWLKRHDVDPTKFGQMVTSFGVQSAVRRAADMTVAYRIDGVPALGIQGRYTVSGAQSHTRDEERAYKIMLETADYLIGLARKGAGARS